MGDETFVIKNLIKGDANALDYLYNKYSKQVYYCALGYLHDDEIAQDITQDLYINLWDNRKNIQIKTSLLPYLIRTTKNLCSNYVRHINVEKKHEKSIVEENLFLLQKSDIIEISTRINIAIQRLPVKCRNIFLLACIEGLKHQEIADDMNISINTVKTQIKIAKNKLKKDLGSSSVILLLLVDSL